MSSNASDNGRRKVVIAPLIGESSVPLTRIVPIWIASTTVNVAILVLGAVLFQFIGGVWAADADNNEEEVATTKVEDPPQRDLDLTNTDEGLDDQVALNYNVERIEDQAVPGLVDPTQAVGVPGASEEAMKTNVPPPPGSGGGLGDAMKLDDGLAVGNIGTNFGGGRGDTLGSQFAGRSGGTRQKMVVEEGGNKVSEAAVAQGLEWLALHQNQDGYWSLHEFNHNAREKPRPAGRITRCNCDAGTTHRNDVAATGLALLPFLGAGITHKPVPKAVKDYSQTVDGGLKYLMRKQGRDGSFSQDMYAHGIATIVMCEAYGMTSDPKLKMSAQRALNFISYAQDDAGGGWRYNPKQAGDLSVTGWQLMALKSGQMAGLTVNRKTLKLAERYLDSVETPGRGGYRYTDETGETPSMTAVGLLCRQYSGVGPRNPGLLKGVQKLKMHPPGNPSNIYYEYYATQVMHHMQGDTWRFWNLGKDGSGKGGIRDTLLAARDQGNTPKHEHQRGSWGGSQGGRLMATSLSLLCLEVYYRHLPLYRRDLMNIDKDAK